MTMGKSYYTVRLSFPNYTTQAFRAELTEAQAKEITAMLSRSKKDDLVKGYHIGRPAEAEWVHAMVFSADALKTELAYLIDTERRLSVDR